MNLVDVAAEIRHLPAAFALEGTRTNFHTVSVKVDLRRARDGGISAARTSSLTFDREDSQ